MSHGLREIKLYIQMERLEELLPDSLFESKDWKAGDVVERVEWLLSMYQARKDVIDHLDSLVDRLENELDSLV